MNIRKALTTPARAGLAAAGLGLAAAEQSAALARDVVNAAAEKLVPGSGGGLRQQQNLVSAAREVPFIVHRVSSLLGSGSPIDRLVGEGGAAERVADLFDQGAPVDRVIRPGGPLDRATRDGGVIGTLTAEDGVVQRLADVTDALNKLTPAISTMNKRIGNVESAVGVANTVAEPMSDLLANSPRFAARTANEVARAANASPRRARSTPIAEAQIVDAVESIEAEVAEIVEVPPKDGPNRTRNT